MVFIVLGYTSCLYLQFVVSTIQTILWQWLYKVWFVVGKWTI